MFGDRRASVFLERGDAQVAVIVIHARRLDALHLDDFTRERDLQRFGVALAQDRQLDLGLRLTAHLLDGIGQRQAFDRRIVDLENQVAGLEPGAVGRRILDRRDDFDQAVFHADFDAESAELALRADLQVLVGVGVEIRRVRVEIGQHAADGVGDQLLVVDRFDVALLDRAENLGKRTQILNRQPVARIFVGQRRVLQADQNATEQSRT